MTSALKLERPLVVIDTETTGVDVNEDRIVSLAIFNKAATVPCVELRFNPGRPIPAEATAVHRITDDDVKDCPPFAAAAHEVAKMLAGCDVGGFNVRSFDVPLLSAELKRAGIVWPTPDVKILDAFRIYKRMETRTLVDAVRCYCKLDHVGAHGAGADALACAAVIEAQAERYGKLTLTELADLERDPSWVDLDGKIIWDDDGVACVGFGKHQGRRLADVDRGYLNWMLGKDFSTEVKSIIEAALNGQYPRRVQ